MQFEEKKKVFMGIASAAEKRDTDNGERVNYGEGMSFWNEDQWLGGQVFIGYYLMSYAEPELQDKGVWITHWPELVTWAHSCHEYFNMTTSSDRTARLIQKLGPSHYTQTSGTHNFIFRKEHTEFVLKQGIGKNHWLKK